VNPSFSTFFTRVNAVSLGSTTTSSRIRLVPSKCIHLLHFPHITPLISALLCQKTNIGVGIFVIAYHANCLFDSISKDLANSLAIFSILLMSLVTLVCSFLGDSLIAFTLFMILFCSLVSNHESFSTSFQDLNAFLVQ
jgi:hypothetical protein